jgi:uncharacterized protein
MARSKGVSGGLQLCYCYSMNRDEALRRLGGSLPALRREFGVARAGLFGSVARDTAGAASDVDILIEFDRAPTLGRYEALKAELARVMGGEVDVATPDSLHRLLRDRILAETVYAEA